MTPLVAPARVAALSLAALVLTTTGAVATGAAASGAVEQAGRAAEGLLLSRDQLTWSADLDDPLFLPGPSWEPGDVRATTYFVRNDTDRVSDVSIAVRRSKGSDPRTDRYVTMSAYPGVDASNQPVITVVPLDDSRHLVLLRGLAPDESGAVTLQASLSTDAPAGTQVDGDTLDLLASLTTTEQGEESGGLRSAAHLELAPLFLGFALVGAAFLGWSRRGRRAGGRHS